MGQRRFSGSNAGMTLIEVLVSLGIVTILIVATTQTIISSQSIISFSRHKNQAMYAAQQIIEQQRQKTFSATSSQTTAPVILDADGNFRGTATITVANLDAYRNQVSVEIDWQEQLLAGKITMKEFYGTNIANDPILN